MSLLADLLSKIKYQESDNKRGIPPHLKHVISDSIRKDAIKKKIVVFSFFALLATITGFGAVYFVGLHIKPSIVKDGVPKKPEDFLICSAEVQDVDVQGRQTEQVVISNGQQLEVRQGAELKTQNSKLKTQTQIVKRPLEELEVACKPPVIDEDPPLMLHETDKKQKAKLKTQNSKLKTQKVKDLARRDMYLYTAVAFESKRNFHQALLNYRKALEIDPKNYIIMGNISGVLLHSGLFEEAMRYSKKALTIKGNHVPSLINLGIAYIKLDNLAEGEGYILRALSIEPSNNYALLNLGLLHERRGKNFIAHDYFLRLSGAGNIQGYLGMARIAEREGRFSDAVVLYRKILRMRNTAPQIRQQANERLSLLLQAIRPES